MSPVSSGVSSLGSSWNSPSLTTPPFPLPTPPPPSPATPTTFPSPSPSEEEDSPVSALLQLSGDLIRAHAAAEEKATDSDEGIVSDNSFESEDNHKRKKVMLHSFIIYLYFSCKDNFFSLHYISVLIKTLSWPKIARNSKRINPTASVLFSTKCFNFFF